MEILGTASNHQLFHRLLQVTFRLGSLQPNSRDIEFYITDLQPIPPFSPPSVPHPDSHPFLPLPPIILPLDSHFASLLSFSHIFCLFISKHLPIKTPFQMYPLITCRLCATPPCHLHHNQLEKGSQPEVSPVHVSLRCNLTR